VDRPAKEQLALVEGMTTLGGVAVLLDGSISGGGIGRAKLTPL